MNKKIWKWNSLRRQAQELSERVSRLLPEYASRWSRMDSCSSRIIMKECECGNAHLALASFCRDRLCPVCQWRRSLAIAERVRAVTGGKLKLLFVTLTIRNMEWHKLHQGIAQIMSAWKRLQGRTNFRAAIRGYVRILEITRGHDGKAHPHLHILCEPAPDYFGRQYMTAWSWGQLWKRALQVEYDPIVDVRSCNDKKGAAAYVAKYTGKILPLTSLSDEELILYIRQIRGVRLIGSGGSLRVSDAEIEQSEMIGDRGSCICEKCGGVMSTHWYDWSRDVKKYRGIDIEPHLCDNTSEGTNTVT